MNKKILITGASGLIGTRLTELLQLKGYEVTHLGRTKTDSSVKSFVWNLETGNFDIAALKGVHAIVNLAGAGVAEKRWNAKRKEQILQSRIMSTKLLYKTLKDNPHCVEAVVSASAIGYYGFGLGEEIYTELSSAGTDFLADVTKQWENEVDNINGLNIRTAKLRIGIVLSHRGGALTQMAMPIKFGVGSPLASGKQYLSWIHVDDLCALFIKAIEEKKVIGPVNATTGWITNKMFTEAIAKIVNRPLWLPNIPSFVLKIVIGEMAEMLINGSKVSPEKAHALGYTPLYPTLDLALKNLLLR